MIVPGGKLDQPLLLRRHIERGGPLSRSAVAVVSYRLPAGPDISSIEPVIATTFGLSPREAALAAKLAMGHSLADAGKLLGLTIETTRNYMLAVDLWPGGTRLQAASATFSFL